MKRLLRWAAHLYPARWREHYGEEFDALLEDSTPRVADLLNILGGAMAAQWKTNAKLAAVSTVAGALIAFAIGFTIPDQFVSQTTFRLRSSNGMSVNQLRDALQWGMLKTLSRDHLIAVIMQHKLYTEELSHYPVETVAEELARKRLNVTPLASNSGEQSFAMTFENTDPGKARSTLDQLGSDLRSNLPAGVEMETMQTESPEGPVSPNRLTIAILGMLTGAVIGLFATWLRGRRGGHPNLLRSATLMAAFCGVGLAIGMLIAFAIPAQYTGSTSLRVVSSGSMNAGQVSNALSQAILSVTSREHLIEVIQTAEFVQE